jgi:hypothetical protein
MIESIRETVSEWTLSICLSALGIILVLSFLVWAWRLLSESARKVVAAGVLSIAMALIVLYASLANAYPDQEEKENLRRLQAQHQQELYALGDILLSQDSLTSSVRTQPLSQAPVAAALQTIPHWECGVFHDGECIDFEDDWVFPYGTNHLTSVEVMAWGEILPDSFSETPIAALGSHLSFVRGVSTFQYGHTASNSYVFEWNNARDGRIGGAPFNGKLELFRNGDVSIVTNGTAALLPRTLPFAHDGFGQDAEWIEANFTRLQSLSPSLTNAAEILDESYAAWVDEQVGIDLTNGLYKFTATFTEAPPEATLLTVGDYSVAVTNAGEYVFVLEKGTEYEFETKPYDESVEYRIQDDLLGEDVEPMLMSWWDYASGEWTSDGGSFGLCLPGLTYPGRCSWMPTLKGSPDITHLGPNDRDIVFEAVLTDYVGSQAPTFEWTASSDDVQLTSPQAQSTRLTYDSFPSWSTLGLTVRADLNGYSLWSFLYPTYGTNDHPTVSFSLSAPEVVFLNDDNRTTRWYRVSLKLSCPVETNATISIAHTGATGAKFASDPIGANCFSLTNVQLSVSSGSPDSYYQFYCACTNLGSGSFRAICTIPSGEILSENKSYRVIEPLRKLVCTHAVPNGGYYNPSRLVYGTNAWLCVNVNGPFSASEVKWRVVSGPGRITATNEWAVSVEPTAPEGEVVVEAGFGRDSKIQPRFVLPIVEPRVIPVRAFVVRDPSDSITRSDAEIRRHIRSANKAFSQVGVSFALDSITHGVGDVSAWDFVCSEIVHDEDGDEFEVPNAQMIALLDIYSGHDCVELYYTGYPRYQNGEILVAAKQRRGIIVSAKANTRAVVHELGHALGLDDAFIEYNSEVASGRDLPVIASVFSDRENDWGEEPGRGFYESSNSVAQIIVSLLMYGYNDSTGFDLPSGRVNAISEFDGEVMVPVGCIDIKRNSEVFSE